MDLYDLMQMLSQGNQAFEDAGYALYDAPMFQQKTMKVIVEGEEYFLKDLHMQVTEEAIILEADDGKD